ncbi:MAG: hypothetical protein K6E84_05350 [Lachnospiraceae bacterium]|nr:hypothetical protein [Lachnospiraceae bacterium]
MTQINTFKDQLKKHYDYCYLESMHHLYNLYGGTDTIITGMSYAVNGIDCRYLSRRSINFAIHSQDLFYDINHVLRAIHQDHAHKIQNVIFTLGYYSFFYDLSLTGTKRKCLDLYWPLFKNMHHIDVTDEMKSQAELAVKDPAFISFYHRFFYNEPNFYGSMMSYEETVPEITKAGGWNMLNIGERDEDARFLAFHHNKHIKHTETFHENVSLFNKITRILDLMNIRIFVMIMPFSPEYLNYINKDYRNIILDVIDNCEQAIHFIDINDYDLFCRDDYLNSDHLNANGAKKLAPIIDRFMNE